MDILSIVKGFYIVESVKCLLADKDSDYTPFRHSHEAWKERFDTYADSFNERLAHLLYDYTALVVAGEMRHCVDKASHTLTDRQWISTCTHTDRETCYERAPLHWNAESILKSGVAAFGSDVMWVSGYGGKKWCAIAEAGLMYKKVPDVIFIDHCVDLTHNGSIYFDKGAGLINLDYTQEYLDFLDFKYSAHPMSIVTDCCCQFKDLRKLIAEAQTLQVLSKYFQIRRDYSMADGTLDDIYPIPVEWDPDVLQPTLKRTKNGRFCLKKRREGDRDMEDRDSRDRDEDNEIDCRRRTR